MPPRASSSSTSSDPSASKKRKTAQDEADSNDPPPPPAAPSPSTSYFFEDGNVLLHIGSTLFKVHRGVLEKAEVFADTLLVGGDLGGEAGELPTIKLDDKEADWLVFLRAMYKGLSFVEKLPTLLETRTLLQLADKYNEPSILSFAKTSLFARSKFEKATVLDGIPPSYPTPYDHDRASGPMFRLVLRYLLTLQEEHTLDKAPFRWIHHYIATASPVQRQRFFQDASPGGDFASTLSNDLHLSILRRVDAYAVLASETFILADDDDIHIPDCRTSSNTICDEAWEEMVRDATSTVVQASYQEALRRVTALFGTGTESTSRAEAMVQGCRRAGRSFWFLKAKVLTEESEKDF